LVALVTVDRWGRKPLLILGGAVMAVSMLTLGFLFNSGNVGTAALIAVVAYIAGFALSWGPVVWVLLAEIFPNAIKGKAMALAVAMQWIANLFVSWSFKVLDGNSMSILAALFVWRFVPETKGQSLEAIQHLWTKKPADLLDGATAPAKPGTANAL
jgi:SP family xylose:H+ symportor-like MFS transporter